MEFRIISFQQFEQLFNGEGNSNRTSRGMNSQWKVWSFKIEEKKSLAIMFNIDA